MVFRNERGAAYILTVVVMVTLFSLTSILLYLTDNELISARSYAGSIGAYEAAVSGIHALVSEMQNAVSENAGEITDAVLNEINSYPLYEIAFYNETAGEPYGGEFRLKTPPGETAADSEYCVYHRFFAKYAAEILKSYVGLEYSYKISAGEKSIYGYGIKAKISRDIKGNFVIDSSAVNESTGITAFASATIGFSGCEKEVFTEEYMLDSSILSQTENMSISEKREFLDSAGIIDFNEVKTALTGIRIGVISVDECLPEIMILRKAL
ncbi:MAG: hypothetical protein LBS21_09355 [Clostridiales bacterium]|jgi:hypothetical protein|nr:hypothetical protein [Clostridiales bacterium]